MPSSCRDAASCLPTSRTRGKRPSSAIAATTWTTRSPKSSAPSAGVERMSARDLLIRLALRDTAEAYAVAVDRHDGAMFAAQFAEDGVLIAPRGRFAGHQEL